MKIVLVNIPLVRQDAKGQIHTGPNAGSRWPFTLPRLWNSTLNYIGQSYCATYAPYPFYMGYAASYLKSHGLNVEMLDFMAMRRFFPRNWYNDIVVADPTILVLEVSKPVESLVLDVAKEWKMYGKKIVLVGPHCASAAEKLLALNYVDHVIKGEYELPLLKIAQGDTRRLFEYEHVEDIDTLSNGENWTPYRDPELLHEYYDPSMQTPITQLAISASRGCKFKCNYCAWPKTMGNRTYRMRSAEMVIDEIEKAVKTPNLPHPVRSVFTDDDTWNIGRDRFRALSAGLGRIGLPWTFMGRLDISTIDDFNLAVENGCVGMRFGIESFQQHVLNTTNGGRNGIKQFENAKAILGRFKNMEFHFTSMRDMPGQGESDWQKDQEAFAELRRIGEANGNKIHHQVSRTMPFPGTDLELEMREAGLGDILDRADYDGAEGETELTKTVREFVPLTISR
jgi:radical SAM superfamily enzyme YgiQ (UPF0313 family)